MRTYFKPLTKLEKIVVAFLALIVIITGAQILRSFYYEHSIIVPKAGGVYIEGSVGKIEQIDPLFVHQGSVTNDLVQLIFSGLTRYDTASGKIIPDLADFKISKDKKTYTFTINERAVWHDGIPVTTDDVFFTYNDVIQNPAFRGAILNYNDYSGIKLKKIDERTIEFLLDKPDSFFLVKTLTGILPRHILGNIPVDELGQSFFNQFPIGSGRYRLVSVTPFDNYTEASLEVFDDFYGRKPNISSILIRVFPTVKDLSKKLNELDGVRTVPTEIQEKISQKSRFKLKKYNLPQYVALFMNTESPVLKNPKVRLALQLGTDKDGIMKLAGESVRVDTPLLEIDQGSWVYQYDVKKANGALFDTEWKIPVSEEDKKTIADDEKSDVVNANEDAPDVVDENDTAPVTFINGPNAGYDWKTSDSRVTITGTVPEDTKSITVNDYELSKFVPGDKGWSYVASTDFGNLKDGVNVYKVYMTNFKEETKFLDSISIIYGDEAIFQDLEKKERADENDAAPVLPVRLNTEGQELRLKLITSKQPAIYEEIAKKLRDDWQKIGVVIDIEVLENGEFQNRLNARKYDLLIFGQNLGYNLDAYPYWHSSQAKEGGFNLSQFKNFIVDSLLEKARLEYNEEDRKETLIDIQEIMRSEVPAVFLYSPTYEFALAETIQNANFDNLATTSDRFADIDTWYAKGKRQLDKGVGIFTFFGWIIKQF